MCETTDETKQETAAKAVKCEAALNVLQTSAGGRVAAILESAGFEAYFVGGCVRDVLRGCVPADIDITTNAEPWQTRSLMEANGCRTYDTGLKHGTVTVCFGGASEALPEGVPGDSLESSFIEITTYRRDGDYEDHRRPREVTFAAHIEEDLARRDFTVNAMAWSPVRGFCDPFCGFSDLQRGLLRCVGDPRLRFSEDALRILRALRFASRFGFTIEGETCCAMKARSGLLSHISGERIYSELCKLLEGQFAQSVLLQYPDILGAAIPEILPMVGFSQNNPHHRYDVWEHSVAALAGLNQMIEAEKITEWKEALRLSALFHDVGKPHCYSADRNGIGHFYGHAAQGVKITERILDRLKTDHKTRDMVLQLIRYHDAVIECERSVVKRWLSRKGECLVRNLIWLKRADNLGQAPAFRYRQVEYEMLQKLVWEVLDAEECFSLKDLAVNGNDLIAAGMSPGRELGEVLQRLLAAVIAGEAENERGALLRLAKEETAMNRSDRIGEEEKKAGEIRHLSVSGQGLAADFIRTSGLHFDFPCGGAGKCGKCKIWVRGAAEPCTEEEKHLLTAEELACGVRLACFCEIKGEAELCFEQAAGEVIVDWAGQNPAQTVEWAVQTVGRTVPDEPVGLACDIGTTTVAMWLVGLRTGNILASVSEANCQRRYGADVISRVSACRGQGTEILSQDIRGQLEEMGRKIVLNEKKIEKWVVTGNTVMLHILEGLDPQSLAVSPFSLTSHFGGESRRELLGAPVYLPYCIGAFTGADLVCAVLASGMMREAVETGKPCLLVDVGTNGEMALARPDGQLICCSAPAGPAFEGAAISCGMNASCGAVSALRRSGTRIQTPYINQNQVRAEVIGGGKAQGVCGSGLLDCIAFMLQIGAMDETGYLVDEKDYEIPGTEVRLTQMDVRQVQMAKAAVCAGIRTLLRRAETAPAEIGAFYLAGGFGSYINMDSAAEIGLFPGELRDKAQFIGNGALLGAAGLLCGTVPARKTGKSIEQKNAAVQASEICKHAEEFQLAADAYFTEQYIKEMGFESGSGLG